MAQNFDVEKLAIIQNLPLSCWKDDAKSFGITLANIPIDLYFSGRTSLASFEFGKTYMGPFLRSTQEKPQLVIHYHGDEDVDFLGPNSHWDDPDPNWRIFPQTDSSFLIIQRNFMARFNDTWTQARVHGPTLSLKSTSSIDNLISLFIHHHLLHRETFLVHAATVVKDEKAWVFFGNSGAGKSTLAKHSWESKGYHIMGGDQIFLRIEGKKLMAHACSTQVQEFERFGPGRIYNPSPIGGLFHLVKVGDWHFKSLNNTQALPLFLRQVFMRPESVQSGPLLDLAMKFLSVPDLKWAEIGYPKGGDLWDFLDNRGP